MGARPPNWGQGRRELCYVDEDTRMQLQPKSQMSEDDQLVTAERAME